MQFETRADVGEEVFVIHEGKIHKQKIRNITVYFDETGSAKERYVVAVRNKDQKHVVTNMNINRENLVFSIEELSQHPFWTDFRKG